MSIPVRRVLELLELLQERPLVTGPEAATRLQVDARTVRRYVAALQALDVPVRAARGPGGGYHLAPGYRMPPLMLSVDQAVAVVVALNVAQRVGGAVTGPAAADALSKLRRVLPLRLHERVRALEQRLWFTTPTRPEAAPAAADTLLTVAEAAERRRTVTAQYQRHDGRAGQRTLRPYGVVLHGGRWYGVALDEQRDELRALRLDRMSDVRIGGPTAPPPSDLHPADFVATALARVPWGWDVEVLLETTLDHAAWRVAPGYGELIPCEEGVILRMQVEDLADAAGLLADLRCPFIVHRPVALRASVEELADSLMSNARRGS